MLFAPKHIILLIYDIAHYGMWCQSQENRQRLLITCQEWQLVHFIIFLHAFHYQITCIYLNITTHISCTSWLSRKGWCNKPRIIQFNDFNTESSDALKTIRVNRNRLWNLATCALGDFLVYQQWHSPSIKTNLLLRCIDHVKSDLINTMDHMRNSGT